MTTPSMVPNVGPNIPGPMQPVISVNCFVPNNCIMVPNLQVATSTVTVPTLFQFNNYTGMSMYIPIQGGFP